MDRRPKVRPFGHGGTFREVVALTLVGPLLKSPARWNGRFFVRA